MSRFWFGMAALFAGLSATMAIGDAPDHLVGFDVGATIFCMAVCDILRALERRE